MCKVFFSPISPHRPGGRDRPTTDHLRDDLEKDAPTWNEGEIFTPKLCCPKLETQLLCIVAKGVVVGAGQSVQSYEGAGGWHAKAATLRALVGRPIWVACGLSGEWLVGRGGKSNKSVARGEGRRANNNLSHGSSNIMFIKEINSAFWPNSPRRRNAITRQNLQ